jgi:hypothetical protein
MEAQTEAEAEAQFKAEINLLRPDQLRNYLRNMDRPGRLPRGPRYYLVEARLAELEAARRNKVIGLLLVAGAVLYWRRRQRA